MKICLRPLEEGEIIQEDDIWIGKSATPPGLDTSCVDGLRFFSMNKEKWCQVVPDKQIGQHYTGDLIDRFMKIWRITVLSIAPDLRISNPADNERKITPDL